MDVPAGRLIAPTSQGIFERRRLSGQEESISRTVVPFKLGKVLIIRVSLFYAGNSRASPATAGRVSYRADQIVKYFNRRNQERWVSKIGPPRPLATGVVHFGTYG